MSELGIRAKLALRIAAKSYFRHRVIDAQAAIRELSEYQADL